MFSAQIVGLHGFACVRFVNDNPLLNHPYYTSFSPTIHGSTCSRYLQIICNDKAFVSMMDMEYTCVIVKGGVSKF